jgi:5'-3' exonuclease
MGITNFNKWLNTNYPSVFKKIDREYYDNVYIDLNPILHVSINKSKNEKDIINKIQWLTNEVLKHIIPNKKLVLSTDGIPSFAKMILQRERRINMVKNIEIKNTTNFINPIILTPGTDFMNSLPKLLEDYFEELKKKYNYIKIVNLMDIEKGESEFKLFEHMKDNIKSKETNILVSNDADVVIMALSITSDKNKISIANSGKIYQEINLNTLIKCLGIDYSNLDFTLLMLLMGNDYIPKVNYVNITKIIPIYKSICKNKSLVENNINKYTINNKLFAKILFRLLGKNKCQIKSLSELNFKKIENYLEGLVWCLNDYHNCKTDNMLYMYNYVKLGINPGELYYYLQLNKDKIINYPINKTDVNVNRKIYPAIVLPYKIKFLVKNNYSEYLMNNHKEYYEEELCETCKDYHKKLSDLNITRKYLEDTDQDTEQIKINAHKFCVLLNSHKKSTHKRLQYGKYIKIINELNNI